MATVRDPNFWKRFSAAVHQDDLLKQEANQSGLKQTNSWLEGQKRKARQRTYMCWSFWLVLALVIAGVVAAIVVLKHKRII